MINHDTYRVLAGRIRMFVRDWPGDGPPVVFLHNFTGNSLLALRLGSLLCGRRRLLAPDLRGRGNSDMPFGDYGLPIHIKDVIACLDRLKIDRFVIAGHSFGATLSLFIAAQYPARVAGLMLFDGGTVPSPVAMQVLDAYYNNLTYHYPTAETYIERFRTAPSYQPWTEELETLIRSNLYRQPDGTYIRRVPRYVVDADRRSENMAAWAQLTQLYAQIRCPVLLVRAGLGMIGREDQVISDTTLAEMVKGLSGTPVTVSTITRAGHTSLMTIPDADRDTAILDFLGLLS